MIEVSKVGKIFCLGLAKGANRTRLDLIVQKVNTGKKKFRVLWELDIIRGDERETISTENIDEIISLLEGEQSEEIDI